MKLVVPSMGSTIKVSPLFFSWEAPPSSPRKAAEGNAACGGARERSIDVDVWYYPAERVEYLEECSEMAERLIAAFETGIDTGEIVLVPDDTVSTTISLGVLVLQFALSWCESAAETGEMMENLEY